MFYSDQAQAGSDHREASGGAIADLRHLSVPALRELPLSLAASEFAVREHEAVLENVAVLGYN